jgi:hypothetical protein
MLLNNNVDAIVTDYQLGSGTADGVIFSMQSARPQIPILVFSGNEELPAELLSVIQRRFANLRSER